MLIGSAPLFGGLFCHDFPLSGSNYTLTFKPDNSFCNTEYQPYVLTCVRVCHCVSLGQSHFPDERPRAGCYRPLLQYTQDLNADDQTVSVAWRLINDSLRTEVCLLYPPYMIALGEDNPPYMIALGENCPPLAHLAHLALAR